MPYRRIESLSDYREFVKADIQAYGLQKVTPRIWFQVGHLRFLLRLRRIEYLNNCRPWRVLSLFLLETINHRLAEKLGFSIPKNTFGPGLCITHRGTVVVNPSVRVGAGCKLHVCTNIGDYNGTPVIGDNVYIGPGAKIYGPITIGDNVAIGANAVVNSSFGSNCTVGGIPARVLSQTGAREHGVFNA